MGGLVGLSQGKLSLVPSLHGAVGFSALICVAIQVRAYPNWYTLAHAGTFRTPRPFPPFRMSPPNTN